MYLHTDFVTHLPIVEGQKVMVFLIAQRKPFGVPEPVSNQTYADKLYEPITLPFIAHYGEHGDFILDSEHHNVNTFMWSVSSKRHIKKELPMPDTITEQTYRDMLSPEIADRILISATDYDSYVETVDHLIDQPVRQGVFTRDETYREAYIQCQTQWLDYIHEMNAYIKTHTPMDMYKDLNMKMDLMDRVETLQPLAQPNMLNMGSRSRVKPPYEDAQIDMAQNTNPELDFFLNGWGIFQAYLDMIRVSFAPVTGIGGQEPHVDMQIWYAEQIVKQVSNTMMEDIIDVIVDDVYLDTDEYDNVDVPKFVQVYHQLSKELRTSIINDENELEILAFLSSCSFDQLKKWHATI